MYENLNQADTNQLFDKSIVTYNTQPVFLVYVNAGFVKVHDLLNRAPPTNVKLADPLFDFTPVKLGNFNYKGRTYFLSRKPARIYKVGLGLENISSIDVWNKGRETQVLASLQNSSLYETIMGVYPKIDQCIKELEKTKNESRAFHRFFSVNSENQLAFREKIIGMINIDNGKAMFKKSYKNLQSVLEREQF